MYFPPKKVSTIRRLDETLSTNRSLYFCSVLFGFRFQKHRVLTTLANCMYMHDAFAYICISYAPQDVRLVCVQIQVS